MLSKPQTVKRGRHEISIGGPAICRARGEHDLPVVEKDWPSGSTTKCATCSVRFYLVRPKPNRKGVRPPAFWKEVEFVW